MCKTYAVLTGLFVFLLSGCSTHWVKPNGSSPLWDVESCNLAAEKRYPVKNEIVYHRKHDYSGMNTCSEKERIKNKGVCRPQYQSSLPDWDSSIIDVNSDTRKRYIKNCMRSRGWEEVYSYPWR